MLAQGVHRDAEIRRPLNDRRSLQRPPYAITPLDFLRAVMAHEGLSKRVRVMAAKALMPYV